MKPILKIRDFELYPAGLVVIIIMIACFYVSQRPEAPRTQTKRPPEMAG